MLLQHDEVYDDRGWLISPHGERVVGYDNHWPKGHHRHVLGEEGPYDYRGIDTLVADFNADVAGVKRRRS